MAASKEDSRVVHSVESTAWMTAAWMGALKAVYWAFQTVESTAEWKASQRVECWGENSAASMV